MSRWSFRFAILVLAACGSDDSPAAGRARDLQTALNPTPPPVDTAKQRADSQFQKCTYVYESDSKLRECLVFIQGWAPPDAERAIAIYKAQLRRVLDSLQHLLKTEYAARARRVDSIRTIERKDKEARFAVRRKKALEDSLYAASFPVWASETNQLYFANRTSCLYAATLPDWDRVLFRSASEAEGAGFAAYDSDVRCRIGGLPDAGRPETAEFPQPR